MKRLILFLVAAGMVLSVLLTVVADVNHGHGPDVGSVDQSVQVTH